MNDSDAAPRPEKPAAPPAERDSRTGDDALNAPDSAAAGASRGAPERLGWPSLVAIAVLWTLVVAAAVWAIASREPEVAGPKEAQRVKGYVVDVFHRDGPVTISDNGRPWKQVSGEWLASSGAVSTKKTDKQNPQLLVADAGTGNQIVTATFPKVRTGCGLVFRFKGPNNYWSLTAAPNSGSWSLTKVVNGSRTNPAKLGTVPIKDGTEVTVRADGGRLWLYFDGRLVKALSDPAVADGTRAGLLFSGSEPHEASADNVSIIPITST